MLTEEQIDNCIENKTTVFVAMPYKYGAKVEEGIISNRGLCNCSYRTVNGNILSFYSFEAVFLNRKEALQYLVNQLLDDISANLEWVNKCSKNVGVLLDEISKEKINGLSNT